jgi:thiol:disulfide interchange protein DsbD
MIQDRNRCLKTAFCVGVALILLIGVGAPYAHAQFDSFGETESILSALSFVSADAVAPGDTIWLAARLDVTPGWHVNSAKPLQDYLIPTELKLTLPDYLRAGEIVYPGGHVIPLLGDSMSVYESGAVIFVPLLSDADAPLGPCEISGTLHYQGCDDNSCLAPDEKPVKWTVTVASAAGNALHFDLFAPVLGNAATSGEISTAAIAVPEQESDLERLIREHGGWGYVLAFLLAFGTGLLLSFSPCTYPMIPITVSIFAGQARGPARGFFLSVIYVLTMAIIYGIMGIVVASIGGVFGAWLAHPVVVGVIVAVFVVFALSMFGLYELQVPASMRDRMAGRGGEGIAGAIVLGAVAALVVSPCVGPFVAGIMLYIATAGSPILGFFVLFTFALGLGMLFIIIGTFSSAINALPNAGVWMESVKRFFGFVLLLMALYFARTLISTEFVGILAGLLFLGAGVFGGGFDRLTSESGFFPRLKKAFGIICTILGIYFLGGYLLHSGLIWPPLQFAGDATESPVVHEEKIPWEGDLDLALERAHSEGRPVLIDTWATWCVNCQKLDRVTWSDDRVAAEATRFIPVKLQLETNDSPVTQEFLRFFGLNQYSLPTIILINTAGTVEVIQGFIDANNMLARMRAIA